MNIFNIFFIIFCFIFCSSSDRWLISIGNVTIENYIMMFVLFFVVLFRVLLVTPSLFNKYVNFSLKVIHLFYYFAIIFLLWYGLDYFLHYYGETIVGYCFNGIELLSVVILCLLKIMVINLYYMIIKRFKIIDMKKE